MGIADIVGLIGAFAYLLGYALIQLRILTIESGRYALLNIVGGIALIYSLWWNFNIGSFITQVAWLGFTIFGYWRARSEKQRAAA